MNLTIMTLDFFFEISYFYQNFFFRFGLKPHFQNSRNLHIGVDTVTKHCTQGELLNEPIDLFQFYHLECKHFIRSIKKTGY